MSREQKEEGERVTERDRNRVRQRECDRIHTKAEFSFTPVWLINVYTVTIMRMNTGF